MSLEFWILLGVLIVGFILTWIICCKGVETSEFDTKPGMLMINPYDAEKESLKMQVYALERKLYSAHREIDYWRGGRYDRPVEVNIENIVKVDNETISKSSSR
jgi:hypothetical protein